MSQVQITIDQQVPLSQVRARYNDIVKKTKNNGYVLVLKNYVPHSIIMDPNFFFKQWMKKVKIVNEQENMRRTQAVGHLLKFRSQIASKIKGWDPVKQLIKDRVAH